MRTALRMDLMTESFLDVELLIKHTANKFVARYGGEVDEAIAHGNLMFVEAYDSWDRSRGKFTQWLYFLMWRTLLEQVRRQTMRNARHKRVKFDEDGLCTESRAHWLGDLLDGLSEDARTIVSMVLDTPMDLKIALAQRSVDSKQNTKGAFREVLQDMGWSKDQVYKAFDEIREAL